MARSHSGRNTTFAERYRFWQDPRYQFFEVRVHTQLVSDVALPQQISSHATPRLLGTIEVPGCRLQ